MTDRSPLSLPVEEIAEEVARSAEPVQVEDPELAALADGFVRDMLAVQPLGQGAGDGGGHQRHREAVDTMGAEVQQQAAHRSAMLQGSIRKLAHEGDEGGPVARALLDLRGRMLDLDPNRHDLAEGGLGKFLSFIPGVGSKLQRYFHKFETAQEAIDAILKDLKGGKEMLRRDNLTLAEDQDALRRVMAQLRRQIEVGRMIDARLVREADALAQDDPQRAFLEEELLFPLRQRIVDLQQQMAVSQQGVLSLEVIIRNNRELMRGVDRAINVTVSALTVAVTVALGLANQKLVLDRVEALNETTSDLIAGTAQALRGQGVTIQTRAASTVLDMKKLEGAFVDVLGAIEEVSAYRRDALPKLDAQIDRLEDLTKRGAEAIARHDRGNVTEPHILPDAGKGQG